MGEIFNLDNKFFQGMNKVIDCCAVNVLWMFCCMPMAFAAYVAYEAGAALLYVVCIPTSVLAGAATTALYYVVNKTIRHGRGYVWREFWDSFKANFKQAAVISMILTTIVLLFALDAWIMYGFASEGEKIGMIYIVFVIFIVLVVLWACYIFPYLARFENGTKAILKNAGFMAVANLPKTGMIFVVLAVAVAMFMAIPVLVLVVPSCYMLLANLILEKVFRKYMTPEDAAAEEERNREYYN